MHRFGEFHVLHPVSKCRQSELFLPADGADKLLFHAPCALLLRRNGYFLQGLSTAPPTKQGATLLVKMQRALTAKQPGARAGCEAADGAEGIRRLGAVGEIGNHIDMVRHIHSTHLSRLGIVTLWVKHTTPCDDALDRPDPAHGGLVPDAHVEDVIPTQLLTLPPVQGRMRIGKV